MKLSDYVVGFLAEKGIRDVFHISGGGIMHLGDSLGRNKEVNYVCTHHEQAATMATEAYSRMKGFGSAIVTTGPGVSNSLTGVLGAWIDSTPMLIISGQTNETIKDSQLRQIGLQEGPTIQLVKPITKYASTIENPEMVKYELEKAIYFSKTGRPGPSWIDITLQAQGAQITPEKLKSFLPDASQNSSISKEDLEYLVSHSIEKLKNSERPVIYAGRGIDIANAKEDFRELIEKINAPVLTSWNGADLIEEIHDLYIGRPGLFGQRYSNFTIQNSDVLLGIGARLSIPQTGYNYSAFCREAYKIIVDIDSAELTQKPVKPDLPINANAKDFIKEMNRQLGKSELKFENWVDTCKSWKERYPMVTPEKFETKDFVNSYVFVDKLSDVLTEKDVIVTDMGASFTTSFQTFKVKKGQRFFTSSGLASMGFGLPGAIGACVGNNRERTICLAGDGGFQFNIQELATLKYYNLPIKLFIFNNKGYNAITKMQDKNFKGNYVGSEINSGVEMPNFGKIAEAYGIPHMSINSHSELEDKIKIAIQGNNPLLCDVKMDLNETLYPRVMAFLGKDGKWSPSPLEDMSPQLPEEELISNMFIDILR
jgi:acetolactate synthase I/II/III large subunit